MTIDNPLLQAHDLPPYSAIRAEHLVPAVEQIIADNQQKIGEIIASQTVLPTWDDLVLAMEVLHERIFDVVGILRPFLHTSREEDWLEATGECFVLIEAYEQQVAQNSPLFELYQRLADSPIGQQFDKPRKELLQQVIRRFRQAGQGLTRNDQQRLATLESEISILAGTFNVQVGKAADAWSKHIFDEAELAGIPLWETERMSKAAQGKQLDGWLISLTEKHYKVVLRHAENRELRKEVFIAYNTRASDEGPNAGMFDNGPVLNSLLEKRLDKARLLGFQNCEALSLDDTWLSSIGQVQGFLKARIAEEAPRSQQEAKALRAFAMAHGCDDLQAWDYRFYRQKMQSETGALNDISLREYFPVKRCLVDLLDMLQGLFEVQFVEDATYRGWHSDVRLFCLYEQSECIGYLFLDLYSRPEKPDGCFASCIRNRRISVEGRMLSKPAISLFCNFDEPLGDEPTFLSLLQLRMLVHELGHCMHQLLSRSPFWEISGIERMSKDAAEFIGKVFEEWCWSAPFLLRMGQHYASGAALPNDQVHYILQSRGGLADMDSYDDLMWALFDFNLHLGFGDGRTVDQVLAQARQQAHVLPWPTVDRFAHSFDYMTTGYEGRYFVYVWGAALAREVFTRFELEGPFNPKTGRAFREALLAPGGSRPYLESIAAFLGRPSRYA